MSIRNLHPKLLIAMIAIILFTISVGSYALPATKLTQSTRLERTYTKLTLTLDKSDYSVGDVARVTLLIQNIGSETLTIDNAEQAPILIVYDNNMSQIGTSTLYHKALPMNPPLGPISLSTGQGFSWEFQWELTVHRTSGPIPYEKLSAGSYNVQGSISLTLPGSGSETYEPANATSNIIQFQITQL